MSQLQPDLALLRPRGDHYRSGNPETHDVLFTIEVMDSSVERDRRVKLPIYARAGVVEVWADAGASGVGGYRSGSGTLLRPGAAAA